MLARHFLERFQREPGRAQRGLSAEAVQAVAGHDWPGNVRENRVKRAVVVAEGQRIRAADLGLEPPSGEAEEASTRLRDAERHALVRAWTEAEGNVSHASRLLGVSRPTLYKLLRDHGLKG